MATYSVNKSFLTWIPVSDGTKLAATVWMPKPQEINEEGKPEEKFPAVLEFLPYRRADLTARRDEGIHSYFCCHGYVSIRVDLRGCGDSEGFYHDEYEKQEQDDGCDVISWISEQGWCSGAVGMFGFSWGGFNSLQIAARQPSALKAIISMCSTDDRYSDDVHYRGGCVMGHSMLSWSSLMFLWNALPANPLDGEGNKQWMEIWLDRLRNLSPWVNTWLSHQTRDEYWKHGSICEDYSRVQCPVFLAGGWLDLYTNPVFRMMEDLSSPTKAIVGPWTHGWPMEAVPGPQIDFLSECLRWWDCHLKGLPSGIMEEPKLRMYLRQGITDPQRKNVWPGTWIAEDNWPSTNVYCAQFVLKPTGQLKRIDKKKNSTIERTTTSSGREFSQVKSSLLCGQASDNGMPSTIGGLAFDQRHDDGLSVCFDTAPLDNQLAVLGFPEVTLDLSADSSGGTLVARLCDVFPDGRSTLICTGLLNLSHRDGDSSDSVKPLEPHKPYHIQLQLDSAAYVVAADHKIRLAISSNYWPTVWPSPFPTCFTIHPGNENVLSLPVRAPNLSGLMRDQAFSTFEPPCETKTLPAEVIRKASSTTRTLELDGQSGTSKLTYFKDYGCFFLKDSGTLYDRTTKEVYTVTEDEPTSARVTIEGYMKLKREASADRKSTTGSPVWDTSIQTLNEMWADEKKFYVRCTLKAFHETKEVFSKTWDENFERSFV